jgi:hypothetical protein
MHPLLGASPLLKNPGAGGGLVENFDGNGGSVINRAGWKGYSPDAFAARSIKRAT